jgi:outer membrane protein
MYCRRPRINIAYCLLFITCWSPSALHAQPDVLTLQDAVNLALAQNRSIEQASLSASGAADAIAAAKTQRLPQLKFSSTTGMLLTRPTITFEKGAFGEYPGIGSVPGDTTEISSARKLTALLTGEVALPLTQQIRIGLGIRSLQLTERIARGQVRLTRHEVIKHVRQAYYSILQKQSSLDAVEQTIELLREVSRQTTQYVKVGTALNADLLDVQARLAKAEYDKVALTGPLATAKEQLNQLLGRPIDTDFRVAQVLEASSITELKQARERAVASRPEIEQARLKIEQAEVERRKKKSEYIPDVSLSVTYYSAINVSTTLPRNVAIAGVQTSWQPFDWGKKRSELAQKHKAIQEATVALRDAEDKVRIEVGSAFRKMQEARVMLSASRASQESTREAARVVSVRFRSNSALLKDVLEAQADLASANDNTQQALLAYWVARADFEKAMGEEQ